MVVPCLNMEMDSETVAKHTESPCSSLLERLKALRRWQDEQRKELEINNLSSSQTRISVNSTVQELEGKNTNFEDIGAHPGNDYSKEDSKYCESSCSGSFPQAAPISCTEDFKIEGENSECLNTSMASQPFESFNGISSAGRSNLNDVRKNFQQVFASVPSEEGQHDAVHEAALHKSAENKESVSSQNLNVSTDGSVIEFSKNKSCVTDYNLIYKDSPRGTLDGLSKFISHHVDDGLVSKESDGTHQNGFETHSKPRFTYLRKGVGTARFGIKRMRLKPKGHNNKVNLCKIESTKDDKDDQVILSKAQHTTTSKKAAAVGQNINSSNISRVPLKSLHLHHVKPLNAVDAGKHIVATEDHPSGSGKIGRSSSGNSQTRQESSLAPVSESDKQVFKELEELSAFEKLEELAEDSSFASNSSTVLQLLQRGLWSSESTPVKSESALSHSTPLHNTNIIATQIKQDNIMSGESEQPQNRLPLMNVSQVLDQLKGIVKLEDLNPSSITQKEMKLLRENITDFEKYQVETFFNFEDNVHVASNNATSTPAVCLGDVQPRPRVHFQPKGVEVLEYELTESEEENTLTDAPSIADDTDLVTTSDLEILKQIDLKNGRILENAIQKNVPENLPSKQNEKYIGHESSPKTSVQITESKSLQPVKLQFSPPCHPQNSASHYIWSIFGKEKAKGKGTKHTILGRTGLVSTKKSNTKLKDNQVQTVENNQVQEVRIENEPDHVYINNEKQVEVETYKTLLMAKVCELEKEIAFYKRENSNIKKLQEVLKHEKCQIELQRKEFQEEMSKEKVKLKEFIDTERNNLWKEKQLLRQQSPTVKSVKEESLEIVYLKEQLHDLQEEQKRKESSHQFIAKKLNDKIRMQDDEIKVLKEKNIALQKKEKENIQLKHELDRAKLKKRPIPDARQVVVPPRKPKLKQKTATINSINKSLDKVPISNTAGEKGVPSQSLAPSVPSNFNENHPFSHSASGHCNVKSLKNHGEKSTNVQGTRNEVFHDGDSVVSGRFDDLNGNNKLQEKENLNHLQSRSKQIENLHSNWLDNNGGGSLTPPNPSERCVIDKKSGYHLRSPENVSLEFTEFCHDDGTQEIIYANGNKKEILPNGSVIMSYYNGDRKETYEDRVVYVYGTDSTRHTTYTNGKEVTEFPSGQRETCFADGSIEVLFPDNSWKTTLPDGSEVTSSSDGTTVRTNPDGIKVIEFVSGQREVHTPEQKRREYPDGTVKILYPDGRTETRYKTGRVRIRDKEGNLLSDTQNS